MLFTWDTTNLCIVFPSWRVTGTFSLIWSLIAVVALTAGYEAIREVSRRYEERVAENAKNAPRKSSPIKNLEVLVLELVTPYLPVVSSRCRTSLTTHGRELCCIGGEERQDCQGGAIWHPGVLFVLHHVSLTSVCERCGHATDTLTGFFS